MTGLETGGTPVDEHFEALAGSGTWARLYDGPETALNTSFRVRLARTMELLPADTSWALDLGCGPGPLAPALLKRGARYVGVDLVRGMLHEARARHPGVRLARGDEHLPFRNEVFDAVIALGFLEYLRDPLAAIAEMRRVVRPGGAVLISVPKPVHVDTVAWTLTYPFRSIAALVWGRRSDRVHRTSFSPAQLDRLAILAQLRPAGGAHYHFTPLPYPLSVLAPRWALRAGLALENWSGRGAATFLAHGYIGRYRRD